MAGRKGETDSFSRRTFLQSMSWAPGLLLAAPLRGWRRVAGSTPDGGQAKISSLAEDIRFTPRYPAKSPLDDVLRRVAAGADEFLTEKYAGEIAQLLDGWAHGLKARPPALDGLSGFLGEALAGPHLVPTQEIKLRSDPGIEILRRKFAPAPAAGRERFLESMRAYLSTFSQIDTAEFEVVGMRELAGSPLAIETEVRYDLVGVGKDGKREERVGRWFIQWERDQAQRWRVRKWEAGEETLSRSRAPVFVDVTSIALGGTDSYPMQMLRGVDYWRTVLDGACGIEVYGNSGVAAGDMDNDGRDDLYICQPSGLPNRLYRNRGDGTFEDVTEAAGVGVLDNTACALFADFENKGRQDLLVVCAGGPLLFVNRGNGKFLLKRDAFQFRRPPQGTFTHAAVADYDHDGRLDIYFCLYSYYAGLDQYHYPVPYFDARNGPRNFLLHNQGNATFVDRTEEAGLNAENDRYSFACAWGDCNSDGWPDLYVANDFGRSNLYRNNGDGTFRPVSAESGVDIPGAGMSACWFDADNDGRQDIYVANMWSAAGMRVSEQAKFHQGEPESVRAFYRGHARGNSLYRNLGEGRFENSADKAGAAVGRWAWSSDAWDFDCDGYADLYVANGYISGPDPSDLSSFFWRQLVAKSPQNATPSPLYEQGWNAINELVRTDATWSAPERNVFYANNRDGTFSEVSGTVGLDFPDDSRAFALADLDHDGRLEIILKNRTAPQLRVLHNAMQDIGNAIAFRLRGTKSNRDAIGAAVTVEAAMLRQVKYLQAGSGFLSQHTKELFFGLGKAEESVRASIRWPSGQTETFENLPANHRIAIEEGSGKFAAEPFAASAYARPARAQAVEPLPAAVDTWLIEPLSAPEFSLPDLAAKAWPLSSFRGGRLLLNFWASAAEPCKEQLRAFQRSQSVLAAGGLRMAAINVDIPPHVPELKDFATQEGITFPVLLATADVAGVYNIVYRYLFDRRRDLGLPSSFLLNEDGQIVKVYEGLVDPRRVVQDAQSFPRNATERMAKALPFGGTLHFGGFRRNDFTYGVAFFQHGYLEQAAASFRQVIAAQPDNPEAHYNLGTLHLRKGDYAAARENLQQAVRLRPEYPEAWNNLGMTAAQQGSTDEAIRNFQESLRLKPDYAIALLNLGNLYRRQGAAAEAEKLLNRALELQPNDSEANYSVGMLYAAQDQRPQAEEFLTRAVALRPEYPEALNNLGVLYIREQRYAEAEEKFKTCVQIAPNFDQAYLNLARLYVILKQNEKARETLLALLRLQPQHEVAQRALEMLH